MNRWEIQKNAIVGGCKEVRGPIAVSGLGSDPKGRVVCPKPTRVGFSAGNLAMSFRWQRSQLVDMNDAKAGIELLDLIVMKKEGHGELQFAREIASSPPPFFCGTPPSRVSNPLVKDAQFRDDNPSPLSTLQLASPSTSSSPSMSPSGMKSGCVRMKFGLKSPTVRVEGFECLSRDRQNSSVTATA